MAAVRLPTPDADFAVVGGRCAADPWHDHE